MKIRDKQGNLNVNPHIGQNVTGCNSASYLKGVWQIIGFGQIDGNPIALLVSDDPNNRSAWAHGLDLQVA